MPSSLARAALTAAALAAVAAPGPTRGEAGRRWYAPDHAKLQLAGNIGFVSPGAGYARGRRLEADVFFGWVPEGVGGTDIFSLTGKLTFAPWSLDVRGPWRLRPLTDALQLTYTFGEQYVLIPDELFPPTALRSGVALGADVSHRLGERTVGFYAELVALDVGLVYWLSDSSVIDPADVFSLALGARLAF